MWALRQQIERGGTLKKWISRYRRDVRMGVASNDAIVLPVFVGEQPSGVVEVVRGRDL